MNEKTDVLEQIKIAIVELDIDSIVALCMEAIEVGHSAYDIVMSGMAKGMEIVGQKYENGEYYLAELIMAGETMKEGQTVLQPYLAGSDIQKAGKIVIGTVKGDLHDIGSWSVT